MRAFRRRERETEERRRRTAPRGSAWPRGIGLGIYTLAMTVVLTVIFLPVQPITRAAIRRMSEAGIDIRVGREHRLYPLGVSWEDVSVRPSLDGGGAMGDWRFDRVSARADLFSLVRLRPAIRWSVGAGGGRAEGRLWTAAGGYAIEGRGEGIQLERLAASPDASGIPSGSAVFTLSGNWGGRDAGAGALELTVNALRVPPITTRMGLMPELHFDTANAGVEWKGGIVTIRDIKAGGREVDVSGQGSCLIRRPLENSLLNLQIRLRAKTGGERTGLLALLRAGGQPGEEDLLSVKGTMGEPAVVVGPPASGGTAVRGEQER